MWTEIAAQISKHTQQKFEVKQQKVVGGGCINQSYAVSDGARTFFVKLNSPSQLEMFLAEEKGLQEMYNTQTIRVPQPLCTGASDRHSYIILEWLEFGSGNSQSWQTMGRQLAAMHQYKGTKKFGWEINNTIGSTPQINEWSDDWSEFFAVKRIGYQLRLAKRKGGSFPDTNTVVEAVREKLRSRQPQPSILHGDLWSGNAACTVDGEPVILDPATYWGDREADIAMTELFGGFPAPFYQGYNAVWPLDDGYRQRKSLYNLYHILNHFNLFGGGYGSQAQSTIDRVLQ
ncbi:MAG: fructosamine kinase family protein [Jaaginema sp. PMC 1079.18]|nr:fructosamine kinase family protein [Jaaginema sp. PMC 1080.18]MEC4849481.1 fructosamine kinase family protein [Jaaginema sp. PMC 1079.18]MEC4866015.1 fructosamine kinase family protein [Jaaginema sp. PMC 1078.18]